jgi:hypothetical protein
MSEDEQLIAKIETNAREMAPQGRCKVHHDEQHHIWILLVIQEGRTDRFTSKTLTELVAKVKALLELDRTLKQLAEMRNAEREKTAHPPRHMTKLAY